MMKNGTTILKDLTINHDNHENLRSNYLTTNNLKK